MIARGKHLLSIIDFTNRATLKVNTQTPLIYTRNLLNEIRRYSERILSIQEVNDIHNSLASNNVDSKEIRKEHVNNIKNNIRSGRAPQSMDICPRFGGTLLQRKMKNRFFIGCSNFHKYRFTKNI